MESSDLSEWAIDQSGRFCANLTGGPYCTGNRLATEAASARHRSARCLPYQTCLRLNAKHANAYSFGLTPTGHCTLWLHASSGLTSKSPRYLDVVWSDLAVALRALPPGFDNTPHPHDVGSLLRPPLSCTGYGWNRLRLAIWRLKPYTLIHGNTPNTDP